MVVYHGKKILALLGFDNFVWIQLALELLIHLPSSKATGFCCLKEVCYCAHRNWLKEVFFSKTLEEWYFKIVRRN